MCWLLVKNTNSGGKQFFRKRDACSNEDQADAWTRWYYRVENLRQIGNGSKIEYIAPNETLTTTP
jgi:hypothetical protein